MTRPVLTGAHVATRRLRSVRPMTGEQIVASNRDYGAAFIPANNLRDGVPLSVRQADNLRSFNLANPANDRGWAHRHEEIGARQPLLPWRAVAFALGFVLYFGAQLVRGWLS